MKVLICDQGKEFNNSLISEYVCDKWGVKIKNTASYCPQSNGEVAHNPLNFCHITHHSGLTEKFNQTLKLAITKNVNEKQTNWDEPIPEILWGQRSTVQSSTKHSPYELVFAKKVHFTTLHAEFNVATLSYSHDC